LASTLALAIALSFGFPIAPSADEAPVLRLDGVTDTEAAAALIGGFNAIGLVDWTDEPMALWPNDFDEALVLEQQRLEAVLGSLGYLDASVAIVNLRSAASTDPANGVGRGIEIRPDLGPLYRIGAVSVLGVGGVETEMQLDLRALIATSIGSIAREDAVNGLENEIVWRLQNASFPFAELLRREVSLDGPTMTANVRLWIETGPSLAYGDVSFLSFEPIELQRALSEMPFVDGAPYSLEEVSAFRDRLTELLGVGAIRIGTSNPDNSDRVALVFEVLDRPIPSDELRRTGVPGMVVTGIALLALAAGQLLEAKGNVGRRLLVSVRTIAIVIVAVAAYLGADRLLALATLK